MPSEAVVVIKTEPNPEVPVEAAIMIKTEPNPEVPETPVVDGVCWRCGGKGHITMDKDEDTPCGACLGTKIPPKPCPACGSPKAKVMCDGMTVCWWCRDCGYRGPDSLDSRDAMKAWNELPRTAAGVETKVDTPKS